MTTPHWQSGWLFEGQGAPHGNFEAVTATDFGKPRHWWRDNGDPDGPWYSDTIGGDENLLFWSGCSLMRSTYGNPEFAGIAHPPNIDMGEARHYFRNPFGWQGPARVPVPSQGIERLVSLAHLQHRRGDPPNFELLLAVDSYSGSPAGLLHFTRGPDVHSWRLVDHIAQALTFEGVAAIASSYGNLECVGCAGGRLHFMWQGDRGWSPPFPVGIGSGRPAFIQSAFGRVGNFEVVTPAPAGADGLLFMWRNNDDPRMPWSAPMTIPGSTGRGGYADVTMIQSSYDQHLELLALRRGTGIVDHYWRDRGPGFAWHGPFPLR